MFRHGRLRLLLVLIGSLIATSVLAVPNIDLPAAATPGGALPQIPQPIIFPSKEKPITREPEPLKKPPPSIAKLRIPVKAFKIEDIVEHPKQGITRKTVEALAESLRKKMVKGKPGLTLLDIRKVARAITFMYRKAGFILATAYIPPQDITAEHIVTLKVSEGKLGSVTVADNVMYSKGQILRIFKPLIGKSVLSTDIEEGLLTLNSYPGMDATGIFRPGKNPGDTDLVIKVKHERRFEVSLGHDNTGTELTGRQHLLANVVLNSPLGLGGRLSGTLVQNYNPKKGEYRAIGYIVPVVTPNDLIGLTYDHNQFTLGSVFEDSGIGGASQSASLYWSHYFIRNRLRTLDLKLALDRREALTFQNSDQLNRDNLTPLRLGTTFVATYPSIRGYMRLNFRFSHGFNNLLGAMGHDAQDSSRLGSLGEFASGNFNKFDFNTSFIKTIFTDQSWVFQFRGQYTQDLLTSLEQFSMGGINSVRAYPASSFLTDEGYFSSFEWIIPAPFFSTKKAFGKYTWGQIIQLSGFIDYSQGLLLQALPTSAVTRVTLSGYGFGIQVTLPRTFIAKFQVAKPFGSSVIPTDKKDTRLWFYIYYTLRL